MTILAWVAESIEIHKKKYILEVRILKSSKTVSWSSPQKELIQEDKADLRGEVDLCSHLCSTGYWRNFILNIVLARK